MVRFRPLTLALLGGLMPAAALAADMPDYGFAPPPVQEFGSNWYLRGDIGYVMQSANARPSASLLDLNSEPVADYYSPPIGGASYDDTWSFGGGFGVRATEWLRVDFTADYRSKSSATNLGYFSTYDPYTELWSGELNPRDVTSNLQTTLLLSNAYLDLGTWSGITPYIGAGVGAAYLSPGTLNIDDVGSAGFEGKWSFAWALMAGASYQLSPNWLVDVGYRYSSIASTSFGGTVNGADGYGPMGDIVVRVGDITAQEIRIGARYMID